MYRSFISLYRQEEEEKVADKQLATLEITVVSAEGLTLSGRPVRKNAFVTLSTDPQNQASTRPDADGGSYPRWDEKLRLALPPSARSLAVKVWCKAGSRERPVGEASIPVSDFYGGILPVDYLHFLSYRLRDSRGERNGIINLTVRVHAEQLLSQGQPPPPPPPLPPLWGFGERAGGDVAVGIPVRHMNMASR